MKGNFRLTAKVIVALFITIGVLLVFVSCGLFDRELLPSEYKDKVDFVSLGNGTHHIEYSGEVFLPFSADFLFVEQSDEDIFLGWNGSWWGFQNQYYSDKADNPLFIYETRIDCLYFHEDYDYTKDTFVIENTAAEIVWEDIFVFEYDEVDFVDPINVDLYSKQCSRIKASLKLSCIDNKWYVCLSGQNFVRSASDEFVKIISENGII